MIPSTLLGLLLLVLLLAPGLAYILRYDRVIPAPVHSPFRETLRVIFVSVSCLVVTGLLFAFVRWRLPKRTPDVRGLVQDPAAFVRGHHVQVFWWMLALIGFATLLAVIAADPRVVRLRRRWSRHMVFEWLLGDAPIRETSEWRQAFVERRPPDTDEVFVGIQMADGSYVQGYLDSYNAKLPEDDQRELTLRMAEMRPAKGKKIYYLAPRVILSAKQITRLDVRYLDTSAVAARDTWSFQDHVARLRRRGHRHGWVVPLICCAGVTSAGQLIGGCSRHR